MADKVGQSGPVEMVAVVAMAENRVIGDGSDLIWHLPGDLPRVKSLTMGCPLIMGRKTWDSIGRPLPGRASIVLTRDPNWRADGAIAVADMDAAIAVSRDWIASNDGARQMIILFGGGQIYRMGLARCNRIELTLVEAAPDGGPDAARFPVIDDGEWDRTIAARFDPDGDVPGFRYETLVRRTAVQL